MSRDQAETLRELFRGRDDRRDEDGAGSTRAPAVFVFSSPAAGGGRTFLAGSIAARLARAGSRVLVIDRGSATQPLAEGRGGVRSAGRFGAPGLTRIAPRLCVLRVGVSTRAAAAEAGEFDVVFIDTPAGEAGLAAHDPRFGSVVILTGDARGVESGARHLERLRRERGITRASVIVNPVTDGREGQAAYQRLAARTAGFVDIQPEYLGHCAWDEKITQPVLNAEFLINLESRARSFPCIELLSKRIHAASDAGIGINMSSFWGTFTEVSR